MTLHFFEYDSNWHLKEIAKIAINNPVAEKFPEWKAEPLPITKQDGDLQVTLARLVAGVDQHSHYKLKPATNGPESGVFLELNILQNGKPANNWDVSSIHRSDATGNASNNRSTMSLKEPGKRRVIMDSGLWPDEPAWKLKIEMSRESGFNPDEMISLQNIPFITNSATKVVVQETNIQNYKVLVYGLTKQSEPKEGEHRTYQLHMKILPALDGYRVSLDKGVNERGMQLNCIGHGNSEGEYTLDLDTTTRARRVDCTIAIHKSRFVEFTAKPEVLDAKTINNAP